MFELLQRYNIKAKKSFGQNFLMDEIILDRITHLTFLNDENIIEIWPWFWALTTRILSQKPKTLTLVELDSFMIEILQDRQKRWELWNSEVDLQIVHQDVLKFEPVFQKYKVIANIPYYITSPILNHFLYDVQYKPEEMIILMQKEVAERIVSQKSSVLSLIVQKKCTAIYELDVPSQVFVPAPKVDSAVVSFKTHNKYDMVQDDVFLKFIKWAFTNPRKKMLNNLVQLWFQKQDVWIILEQRWFWENTRAEELSIEDFIYCIEKLILEY